MKNSPNWKMRVLVAVATFLWVFIGWFIYKEIRFSKQLDMQIKELKRDVLPTPDDRFKHVCIYHSGQQFVISGTVNTLEEYQILKDRLGRHTVQKHNLRFNVECIEQLKKISKGDWLESVNSTSSNSSSVKTLAEATEQTESRNVKDRISLRTNESRSLP